MRDEKDNLKQKNEPKKITITLIVLLILLIAEITTSSTINNAKNNNVTRAITLIKCSIKETKRIKPIVIFPSDKSKTLKTLSGNNNTKRIKHKSKKKTQKRKLYNSQNKQKNNYGKFLLSTNNIDVNYKGTSINLSDSERTELAHLIMGEAGGEGFEGCCLLAQCVRDAMTYRGYTTISSVISGMSYYGYKYDTNNDVENAIDYIFTQGNSAVQHRILVMYASDLCDGGWHESQNFVYQHNAVRYFDMWNV